MAEDTVLNSYGEVILHTHSPRIVGGAAFEGATPAQVAEAYLAEMQDTMQLSSSRFANAEEADKYADDMEAGVISYQREKIVDGSALVLFQQSAFGLDVFEARMGVHVDMATMQVTSAQSSMHGAIRIQNPKARGETAKIEEKRLSTALVRKRLGHTLKNVEDARIARQVIYRFEPDQRQEDEHGHEGCFGGHAHNEQVLPKLKGKYEKGLHYIVDEVLFRAPFAEGSAPINWRALVDPETDEVLYLRALASFATALVFERDPQTQSNAAVTAASTNAVLNPFRSTVTLQGLTSATPQDLSGEYIEIDDFETPTSAPPTVGTPSGAFNYNVKTNNFSAVNAYHHCDGFLRKMIDLGFTMSGFFDNETTFPIPVDHRGRFGTLDGNEVNAYAAGNSTGWGLEKMAYMLAQENTTVGMSTSVRVVWHEWGHGVLYDHVGSPNFGFAHSAGDAMAAIHFDVDSQAGDRFNTFPWITANVPAVSRRHDRSVTGGWAWFGTSYNTQYGGEQVLGTTLFRLYRSLGGDSTWQPTRRRAADTALYLILKGISLLSGTTNDPRVYVTAMQNADTSAAAIKGVAGGANHKVVRWAFEKQGLFQPGAVPGGSTISSEGNPPDVDVYIDDGRAGEYEYQRVHWQNQDMWVRRAPDGGTTHEPPIVNQPNYMYVRVKNRGTQAANSVRVDAYHCLPGTGLAFPDDWMPMTTPTLALGSPIPSGGQAVLGPFEFTPTQVGHECLLAIAHADGDEGNDTTIQGTIPEGRFVPFDNNIGQRNVNPVPPSFQLLAEWFNEHRIWVRNPFREVKEVRINVRIPRLLRKLGWKLHIVSEGQNNFKLAAMDRREVVFKMEPGEDFDPKDLYRSIKGGDDMIEVEVLLDGELSGGMSYPLSFEAEGKDGGGKQGEEAKPHKPILSIADVIDALSRRNEIKPKLYSADDLSGRLRRISFDFDDDE